MNDARIAQLHARISTLDSISTAPAILQPLLALMRTPEEDISMEKVVELISRDGAIAAQCLRVANSPLFGCRMVETVRAAVMILGIGRIRSIVFGLCLNNTIPADKWVINRNAFWRHSLGCALLTQTMASKIGYPEPERAYLAGLLHDIGFLVMSVLENSRFRECLHDATVERCPLHVSEQRILGFTHEDAGSALCKHWGFSRELAEAAGSHHRLELMGTTNPIVCLVHLGDLLCRVRNLGYGFNETMAVSFSQETAWAHLVTRYPALGDMDLFRFTLDADASMDQIARLVDSVFAPVNATNSAHA